MEELGKTVGQGFVADQHRDDRRRLGDQQIRQTRHLLDARTLALCKRGATVINVSRGAIIDTEALCAALTSGQIAAAGLDVTDPEPLPEDHPLWRLPRVLVTPHVAVEGSRPTERRIAEGAIAALHSFRGHAPAATGAL